MNVRDFAHVAIVVGVLLPTMISAQETGGYWVKHVGQMSDVMMRHDYSAHIDLATLKGLPHLYAIGPAAGLNGEITVIESEPSIATVEGGKVQTGKNYPRAAFLVYGQVEKWQAVSIPATVKTEEELDSFVGKAARSRSVNVEKAFPFLVKGTPTEIAYHVVKAGEHLTFTEIGKPVQILGFYSTHDQGVFVHHGTNVHLHFMTEDRKTSGHIDALKLSGASTLYLPVPAPAQQKHADGVNQRGNLAMGLDHAKTTHHFRLLKDGGAVGIEANDEQDTASQDAIRQHLQRITKMFADGNFDLPMFIHATTPPGMETMKRLRKSILYRYSETPRGAEVRLSTHNPQALAAIQQFLRFQIQDHQTGDPLTVQNER